jgi:subtilisin family serine protease
MESEERERRSSSPPQQTVTSRREQYLIARRPGATPPGVEPLDFGAVKAALERDPEISIKRTLTPSGFEPLAAGLPGQHAVIVAEMTKERAEQMSRLPQLVVERDYPLAFGEATAPFLCDPGVLVPRSAGPTVTVRVIGKNEAPVEGANVYVLGDGWPGQAVTDTDGQARITLFAESLASVQGLYVKPKGEYWGRWIPEPALEPNQPNVVSLTPLDQTFPNFPDHEVVGWGLKAMRLDQLPATFRGTGVRIGVVDSGLATSHQDLQSVAKGGYDAVAQNPRSWDQDEVGHGSHCAGIIAGLDDGRGIRGVAPGAEVFAIKVLPGGRLSNLIEALNRCVELQVDLVNLSLGSEHTSDLLDDRLREMKELGIACIVAAGSTGGPVQYPASSPHVLAVAAVGKQGEFPADSYHGREVWEGSPDGAEGYFSASFTCSGPEIDVCAPGVAILSCVPPNTYGVWDGTSMAAPHVTGLAALILAHHPDFQGPFKSRNTARVERLFQVLRQSARPLNLGDPNRTGAGMPDAINALLIPQPEGQALRPDELVQRLVALLESSQATPADRAAAVQQCVTALQQAAMTPMAAAGPTVGLDPRFALKQLRAAMQQAGLLPSKGRRAAFEAMRRASGVQQPGSSPWSGTASGALGSSQPGNGWPMRQLTEAMRYAGLI